MPARSRRPEKPLFDAVGDTVTAFADLVRSLSAAATRGAERARTEIRRWRDAATDVSTDAKGSAREVGSKAATAVHDLTDKVEDVWRRRGSHGPTRSERGRSRSSSAARGRRRR